MVVHHENGVPIQLEDRYILGEFAPDCLNQDFSKVTPSAWLSGIAPLAEAEHIVRATIPDGTIRDRLGMDDQEACLLVLRRTWANGRPVSFGSTAPSRHAIRTHGALRAPRHEKKQQCFRAQGNTTMNKKQGRIIKAPTGSEMTAKSWLTEAPLRMIMNNLDPDVAERPEELVVYGGIGKAARKLGVLRRDCQYIA